MFMYTGPIHQYMSKQVEELEQTVSELESTVRALTEELVETKDRLRVIEAELDIDPADVVDEQATSDDDDDPSAPSDDDDSTDNSSDSNHLNGDDIIVA